MSPHTSSLHPSACAGVTAGVRPPPSGTSSSSSWCSLPLTPPALTAGRSWVMSGCVRCQTRNCCSTAAPVLTMSLHGSPKVGLRAMPLLRLGRGQGGAAGIASLSVLHTAWKPMGWPVPRAVGASAACMAAMCSCLLLPCCFAHWLLSTWT
jgi:hypothetical protein